MYILGHLFVTERAGLVDEQWLLTRGLRALMLPDATDSHGWGYAHAWCADLSSIESRLIRSHIAADWLLHFGPIVSADRRRQGWVYRRMGVIARSYDQFFRDATDIGLRPPGPPSDSRRGFAHSSVEYAIDTYLADSEWAADRFSKIVDALAGMTASSLSTIAAAHGVDVTSPHVEALVDDYAVAVARSSCPRELAAWSAVRKFGLATTEASVDYVLRSQQAILESIPGSEFERVIGECVGFVQAVETSPAEPIEAACV